MSLNPFLLGFYWVCYDIRCLILRTNGELSVLDMDDGHEHALTNSVELFWVTCSQFEEKGSLIKEVSWLDYGHRGMQVRCSLIVFHIYSWVPLLGYSNFSNVPFYPFTQSWLQVWYPSQGANPFKQEDFLQV